ncbi:hypothetical protein LARV_01837 [Longilinea arvoryzae]|uniref:Uncharacterized protein n=1 Tax=Longilinea arvoryzae TaxID=360412 RepID=A0A0S7BJG9_9CHLR|nr:hypothetical protein [Longilinea arvoryzae]GAP14075.1 hypothetical protein LARV_01837 [Longilinea arvoryzae]
MSSSDLNARYYAGVAPEIVWPVERYLPPVRAGIWSAWLQDHITAGGWVLDPLGSHPGLAFEAARAGYRVLATVNNPIFSFMLDVLARGPGREDFQSALVELADSRRGEERLETHIQSLYLSACPNCGHMIPAQAFLWDRDAQIPYARVLQCQHCAFEGEAALTENDLSRLELSSRDAQHRARAIERIGPTDTVQRDAVAEALKTYLPRPLYALTTMINKVDALAMPPEKRRLAQALLLSVCDSANTLWPVAGGRSRPRQLGVPPQFRENNLWLALEAAVEEWSKAAKSLSITHWPDLPAAGGGICLFPGRMRSLLPLPPNVHPEAVLLIFPRPNQALWTLSALWAGWIWGREAVQPMRSVLDRKHFDWYWQTGAFHGALSGLAHHLGPDVPWFAAIPEITPGLLLSSLTAAHCSGLQLTGLALESEAGEVQLSWKAGNTTQPTLRKPDAIYRQAIRALLLQQGEPVSYLPLYTASLTAQAAQNSLPDKIDAVQVDLLSRVQAQLAAVFADRAELVHFPGASRSGESGHWGLARKSDTESPLADRVEMEVVRCLQKNPGWSFAALYDALCLQFRGLLTPPEELVRAVLDSYAEVDPDQPDRWSLRPQEHPAARRADLEAARELLLKVAATLRLSAQGDSPTLWRDSQGEILYAFYPMASSLVSRYVLNPDSSIPPQRCVVVLPGGRAGLLGYKLKRDPNLEQAFRGWRVLKFRHLRRLSEWTDLNLNSWNDLLDADPLGWDEATQLSIL